VTIQVPSVEASADRSARRQSVRGERRTAETGARVASTPPAQGEQERMVGWGFLLAGQPLPKKALVWEREGSVAFGSRAAKVM
jgi:hypothetical protein